MRSRVGIVVPLAVVSGWISAAGMALGAQEGSLFFEGFDGRWTVTAVVHGPAGETVERTLKATIRRSHMAPAQLVEIVLTGPLPAAFEMTCPDGHGVPLPCETRFSLACYCEREEQWFEEPFLRAGTTRSGRGRGNQPGGVPDPTGTRLVLKRVVDGHITSLDVWTKRDDGFELRHLELGRNGESQPVATLTFADRRR